MLPLAVSLIRIASPVKNIGAAIFAATLVGVELTPTTLAAGNVETMRIDNFGNLRWAPDRPTSAVGGNR